MKYKFIVPLFLLSVLASCEKEITVKVPEYKPLLVINSSILVGDPIVVGVGKSASILKYKDGQDLDVTNAKVALYQGNILVDEMQYDNAAGNYVSNVVADAGQTYSIKVTAPGYDEASATTQVPEYVPIASLRRTMGARLDVDGAQQDELKITFTDPPGAGDYYIIMLLKGDESKDNEGYNVCINTVDASVEDIHNEDIDQNTCFSGRGIFLRDALFNGTTKELKLFVSSGFLGSFNGGTETDVYVVLEHVTEDYFKFQKSYQFAGENSNNPFAEPTNVSTNVKNGLGVFSVMSYDVIEVE